MNNKSEFTLTHATITVEVVIAGNDYQDWLSKNWMTVMKEQQPEANIEFEPLSPDLHCYSDDDIPYNGLHEEMPIGAYFQSMQRESDGFNVEVNQDAYK